MFSKQVYRSVYSCLESVRVSVLLLTSVSRDLQLMLQLFQLPIMLNRLVVAAETAEGSLNEMD